LSASDLRREAAANDWSEAEWLAGKKSNFEVRERNECALLRLLHGLDL